MKRFSKITALLAVLVMLMGLVRLPVSANQFTMSSAAYVITRGITEDPLGPAADELYKGVTYYGWATMKDKDTDKLVNGLELTAKAEIINPEGQTVKSLRIAYNESYTDALLDDFSMNQFYLEFVPDMLGTWTFSVTYLDKDGSVMFGPYTVTKECAVPSLRLETWFSPVPMRDIEAKYALPEKEVYFNYKLTYWKNGHIMYENIEGFTIDVELYAPDGTHWTPELLYPYRALNSVELTAPAAGTWSVVVTLEGDVKIRSTTQLQVLLPGDVNLDGEVDASDAALILYESALIGSGEDGEFTEKQELAADFNMDGEINAGDASLILAYAAAAGSGNANAE